MRIAQEDSEVISDTKQSKNALVLLPATLEAIDLACEDGGSADKVHIRLFFRDFHPADLAFDAEGKAHVYFHDKTERERAMAFTVAQKEECARRVASHIAEGKKHHASLRMTQETMTLLGLEPTDASFRAFFEPLEGVDASTIDIRPDNAGQIHCHFDTEGGTHGVWCPNPPLLWVACVGGVWVACGRCVCVNVCV